MQLPLHAVEAQKMWGEKKNAWKNNGQKVQI